MGAIYRPYSVFEDVDAATAVEDHLAAKGIECPTELLDALDDLEVMTKVGTFDAQNTEGALRAGGKSIKVERPEDRRMVAIADRNFQPETVQVGPGENSVSIKGAKRRRRANAQS